MKLGTSSRLLVAAALLAGTALFLQAHSGGEIFPSRRPLASLPETLGPWSGTDIEISQEVRDILGNGEFVQRVYQSSAPAEPTVDLFVAYFPTQRAGDTIHSPKHCLPGAGWLPVASARSSITPAGRPPFDVNRYIVGKGTERQLVLYWYWAHDRAVASEYWAKFYLVADSIRMNRSDGALVRVNTPIAHGETQEQAQQRLMSLLDPLLPLLDQYIPR
jgi:EpsI family protein